MLATLVGAIIRLDECTEVDSIDNLDTLSGDVTLEVDCTSLKREANRFHLVNGPSDQVIQDAGADMQSISVKQFFVPTSHQIKVIKGCHHDTGHQGLERTMALMKE